MDDVAWDEDTDDDDLQEFICISERVEGNRRDSLRNGVNPPLPPPNTIPPPLHILLCISFFCYSIPRLSHSPAADPLF